MQRVYRPTAPSHGMTSHSSTENDTSSIATMVLMNMFDSLVALLTNVAWGSLTRRGHFSVVVFKNAYSCVTKKMN